MNRDKRRLILSLALTAAVFVLLSMLWFRPELAEIERSRPPDATAAHSPATAAPAATTPPAFGRGTRSPASIPGGAQKSVPDAATTLPPAESTPASMKSYFNLNGDLVRATQTDPDADGFYRKVKVVRTDFKYPLVRVVERFWKDPAAATPPLTGDRLVAQTAMIADHLIVKVADGFNEASLARAAARYGGYIRRPMQTPGLFIVAFEGSDPLALERMMASFRDEAVVARAEPDYLVHPN